MKITKKELIEAFEQSLELNTDQPISSENAKEILHSIDNVLAGTTEIKKTENLDILKEIKSKANNYKNRSGLRRVYGKTTAIRNTVISFASVAAAIIAIMILPGIFKEKSISPYQILSWKGNPYIQSNSKKIKLKRHHLIHGNMNIATGRFDNLKLKTIGATVILSKNTAMTINQIKNIIAHNRLIAGIARFIVKKDSFAGFNVTFPGGSLKVTGTDFTIHAKGKNTSILVMDGTVAITRGIKTSHIKMGNGLHINDKGMQKITTPKSNRHFTEIYRFISSKKKSTSHTTIIKQKLKKKIHPEFRERIHLKNGTVLTGRILFQDKKVIRMKTSLGIMNIPWKRINKVSYMK